MEKQYFSDDFTILNKIGKGSFGEVYLTEDKKGHKWASKVEEKRSNSRLRDEYNIYKKIHRLGPSYGIPKILKFLETPQYNIMVMELLGPSLDALFTEYDKKFDIGTVLKIAIETVSLLKEFHNAGFIHRDIKPNNFLVGFDNKIDQLYIMDFGLSKQYINKGKHIDFRSERSLIGTARYASLNIHFGLEPSRRDDLESTGYMFVYLIKGCLPWQGLKKGKKLSQMDKIGEVKLLTQLETLCEGLPSCFFDYLTYCRKLKFDETPDYEYLQNLFINTANKNNIKLEYIWTCDKQH